MTELRFLRGLPLNCACFGFTLGLVVAGWCNPLFLFGSAALLSIGIYAQIQVRRADPAVSRYNEETQ